MSLLIFPPRKPDEGHRGYRLRLTEANMLPPSLTGLVDLELAAAGCHVASDVGEGIWVQQRARYCPYCLSREGYWRLGWELLYADACSSCGRWLVDTCGACGDGLGWRRESLMRCTCGAHLCDEITAEAPPAVARLSRSLEQRAVASSKVDIQWLSAMSPHQCMRLVRLIGSYGTLSGQRKPQKVTAGLLTASWPITSYAAEVLCNWPAAFHVLLDKLRAEAPSHDQGRMGRSFGGFYRALYVALRDPAFDWVRDTFEDYVADHWTGSIGRRNRRLPESILGRINWMPSQAAAKQLGVSVRRLEQLIAAGQIVAEQRTTQSGRRYQVVRRSDVSAAQVGSVAELTLAQAASALGLKRQRLARLLPVVCPAATKVADRGAAWAIPRAWVQSWVSSVLDLPIQTVDPLTHVTLDQVLRFWVASDGDLARLLLDIKSGELRPTGRVVAHEGLPSLVFSRADAMRYAAKGDRAPRTWFTVQDVAEQLEVKQQVAYDLARIGLLSTHLRQLGRRQVHCVEGLELEAFRKTYVFAREIAKMVGRSPRAVVSAIECAGIQPAAGPRVNGCRQVVFARAAIEALGNDGLFALSNHSKELVVTSLCSPR